MNDTDRLTRQIHELQGSMLAMECFVNSLTEALSSDARVVVQAFYASESAAFRAALMTLDRARGDGRRLRARRPARAQPARRAAGVARRATPDARDRRGAAPAQPMQVRFFPVRLAS